MPTSAGSIDSYFDLARIIGQDRPVYGLALPASDDNWNTFESLQELAASTTAKLLEAPRLNGPIYLLGYSFAGHLALETARQLAEHGVDVPLVAVADQVPHGNSFSLGFRIRYFVETFGPWTLRVATSYVTDATQRLNYANAMRRKLKGQHQFEHESWFQSLPEGRKNYTKQNLANLRKYRFEGVYRGKILLLRALGGKPVDPFQPRQLDDYGWGRFTGATVDVVRVPGDHVSILHHPDVVYVGGAVRQALNNCDRKYTVRAETFSAGSRAEGRGLEHGA